MEKRVLLAVFLSFLVMLIYQSLVPPPSSKPDVAPPQQPPSAPGMPPPAAVAPTEPKAAFVQPVVSDLQEREVAVENDAVRALFSTRGAVLKSWRLKSYLDERGQPLELVPQNLPPELPRPFSLRLDDPQVSSSLSLVLFRPDPDALRVQSGTRTLRFEYSDVAGLTVWKEFTFDAAHPYVVTFGAGGQHMGKPLTPIVQLGAAVGSGANVSGSSYYVPARALVHRDGKVERIPADKLTDPARARHQGTFPFAGVDDRYFLFALLAPRQAVTVDFQPISIPGRTQEETRTFVAYSVAIPAPADARFFIGPKDFDVLASIDRELVRAIDFGMFAFIVVPLLRALKWINGYVGNYGWSIIILTILINAAMFPLRHKSVVSMRKMQEIQPQMKAIQDRYAKLKMNDPARQKMNVELMNLYRERGVNPASGCVPMLLTMPVLFAFYALLSVAIELRGAPFVGWIKDLSAHDPLYITPVLMGATMLWQQKLTPMTSADPVQQKMMMFMPLMFTFFFLWAPSGLVLYWFVSNLWGIGQQIITNRIIGPPRVHAARPPAERRLKHAGGGRTEQASKDRA